MSVIHFQDTYSLYSLEEKHNLKEMVARLAASMVVAELCEKRQEHPNYSCKCFPHLRVGVLSLAAIRITVGDRAIVTGR